MKMIHSGCSLSFLRNTIFLLSVPIGQIQFSLCYSYGELSDLNKYTKTIILIKKSLCCIVCICNRIFTIFLVQYQEQYRSLFPLIQDTR